MQKREAGSATVIAIVVVVSLLVITAGLFVWRQQSNKQATPKSEEVTESVSIAESKKTVEKPDQTETITEVNLTLQHVGDVALLPATAPESFVEYMTTRLNDLTCDFEAFPNGGFVITKISPRFVAGGVACEGGASTVWYLTGLGWDEMGFQSIVPCSSLIEKAIPSDFVEECYEDENPESVIANPNGPLNSSDTD